MTHADPQRVGVVIGKRVFVLRVDRVLATRRVRPQVVRAGFRDLLTRLIMKTRQAVARLGLPAGAGCGDDRHDQNP